MTARSIVSSRQQGLSLVELLIAMAIGLVVIGAGASAYLSISTNTRNGTAMARMTEDASIALNIMRANIAMAGYSRPIGKETVSDNLDGQARTYEVMTRAFKGGTTATGDANQFIAGCDGNFTNPKNKELDIAGLACNASTQADAIAVVYEADADGTYPNAAGEATDCLGNAVPARVDLSKPDLRLASNKFYIDEDGQTGVKGLYCQGNGRGTPPTAGNDALPSGLSAQMIVENIVDMKILYGIGPAGARPSTPGAQAYLTAAQVRDLAGAEKWSRVVSVRICVTVRSPATLTVNGAEQPKYIDCDGEPANNGSTTSFVRTFTSTVVLHNRVGTLNLPTSDTP